MRSITLTVSEGVLEDLRQEIFIKKGMDSLYGLEDEFVVRILRGFKTNQKEVVCSLKGEEEEK